MRELPPELLIDAYLQGCFPMADPQSGDLEWYRPDPRAIIELDGLRVSRSLARTCRSGLLDIRRDTAFEDVVAACAAARPGREDTWIDARIARACAALHEAGLAHSLEAWKDGRLVGGLYGVRLGGAFFGESMFSDPAAGGRDASKVCLVHLVEHLRAIGAALLDIQFLTPHLERLGGVEIPAAVYQRRLKAAVAIETIW
ncbi:MAG: leucyl/phenylalanyl-tRNA--protein transferase [Phycisphaerales bacterium]|nr:leucyl/phenylalanyl-tRNA--protein transferase [Phycisphaerales bacterium]